MTAFLYFRKNSLLKPLHLLMYEVSWSGLWNSHVLCLHSVTSEKWVWYSRWVKWVQQFFSQSVCKEKKSEPPFWDFCSYQWIWRKYCMNIRWEETVNWWTLNGVLHCNRFCSLIWWQTCFHFCMASLSTQWNIFLLCMSSIDYRLLSFGTVYFPQLLVGYRARLVPSNGRSLGQQEE
jgi:hypothetical protein